MENEQHGVTATSKGNRPHAPAPSGIVPTFVAVVTRPAEFFSAMPRTGGYAQPLIFMVVMGVAGGLIRAVLGMLGLLTAGSTATALTGIILAPVLILIFGFIGAAILFIIWKMMGSQRDFETAYRCVAYGSAISPLTQFLMLIPYLGIVLALGWWAFILVAASNQVHDVGRSVAITVFGGIAAVLALAGIGMQLTAQRMMNSLTRTQHQLQLDQTRDPAKAAQDLGKLLQQMQKASGQGGSAGR